MKTKAELIASFKRMNKQARERKAYREGYPNAAAYFNFLTGADVNVTVKVTVTTSTKNDVPTIHIVDVLDKSGSMQGQKISSALRGINRGVRDLIGRTDVKYTYTLCSFSSRGYERFHYIMVNPEVVDEVSIPADGYTALYDAIGKTIKKLRGLVKSNDKILVNIYTDGDENDSRSYKSDDISRLIAQYSQEGWTFTFIGTKEDVRNVNQRINIDISNSLVYDGTAQGLERGIDTTISARQNYTKNVVSGQDVKLGFYKNIK